MIEGDHTYFLLLLFFKESVTYYALSHFCSASAGVIIHHWYISAAFFPLTLLRCDENLQICFAKTPGKWFPLMKMYILFFFNILSAVRFKIITLNLKSTEQWATGEPGGCLAPLNKVWAPLKTWFVKFFGVLSKKLTVSHFCHAFLFFCISVIKDQA